MVAAIRQQVTVQPGGVVEVRSSELTPGARADVIVLVGDSDPVDKQIPTPTWASFIGSAKGRFKSIEEVDAYIRALRDEWDR